MLDKINLDILPKNYQPENHPLQKHLLALAISGGPDSIAMLHMFHEKGLQFTALTVDHGLRPESAEEAAYVADMCKALGIKHVILEWQHDGITSNVHDQAREARYSLMTDWCNAHGAQALCTAHHMDDRVEHFLIRVSRGAGIMGLIDHETMLYNGVTVVRPMFAFAKHELVNYLNSRKIKYFEDKSNNDPKYLRSNIRKWLDLMPQELEPELFRRRIIGVKENLERASKVIQRVFEEEMGNNVSFEDEQAIISQLPIDEEIAIMLLSYILPKVSDREGPPRMEAMKRLYISLLQSDHSKTTLCGCIVEKKKDKILIYKEHRT